MDKPLTPKRNNCRIIWLPKIKFVYLGVIIKVMANENTFKVIDMQSLIQQHMEGHISEQQLIEQCKAVLGR